MGQEIIYISILFVELLFAISIAVYTLSILHSSLMGAPYVPSKQIEAEETLKAAGLKPKQKFLELGSGDGRVVRTAVNKYGVIGTGIDVNYLLVLYAGFLARKQNLNNVSFVRANIFNYSLSDADVIYLFLMPEMIEKLTTKFTKEVKPGALVISHGFKIKKWDKYLVKTLHRKVFSSYFYRKT